MPFLFLFNNVCFKLWSCNTTFYKKLFILCSRKLIIFKKDADKAVIDKQSEEELKGVIDLYKTSNPDYEKEKEMLQSILQLNDITVEEIFTHRKNIYSIDSSLETKSLSHSP